MDFTQQYHKLMLALHIIIFINTKFGMTTRGDSSRPMIMYSTELALYEVQG